MSENPQTTKKGGNWGVRALITGAVAAWLVYDIATATEEPSRAVMILQYVLLAGTLIGFAGSLAQLMAAKP